MSDSKKTLKVTPPKWNKDLKVDSKLLREMAEKNRAMFGAIHHTSPIAESINKTLALAHFNNNALADMKGAQDPIQKLREMAEKNRAMFGAIHHTSTIADSLSKALAPSNVNSFHNVLSNMKVTQTTHMDSISKAASQAASQMSLHMDTMKKLSSNLDAIRTMNNYHNLTECLNNMLPLTHISIPDQLPLNMGDFHRKFIESKSSHQEALQETSNHPQFPEINFKKWELLIIVINNISKDRWKQLKILLKMLLNL